MYFSFVYRETMSLEKIKSGDIVSPEIFSVISRYAYVHNPVILCIFGSLCYDALRLTIFCDLDGSEGFVP